MRFLYFDTEFTGLSNGTTPISIGVVSNNNETFYGETTDFDRTKVDAWIQCNVVDKLILGDKVREKKAFRSRDNHSNTMVCGSKDFVGEELLMWVNRISNGGSVDDITLVSDVPYYDLVMLCDMAYANNGLAMPYNFACCIDLNQMIAEHYGVSIAKAFDMSREDIIVDMGGELPFGEKHTSLYDAKVMKSLHELMMM